MGPWFETLLVHSPGGQGPFLRPEWFLMSRSVSVRENMCVSMCVCGHVMSVSV